MEGDKLEKIKTKQNPKIQNPLMTPATLLGNMIWILETGIL